MSCQEWSFCKKSQEVDANELESRTDMILANSLTPLNVINPNSAAAPNVSSTTLDLQFDT